MLSVKNNGDTNTYSRRGYVQMSGMQDIRDMVEDGREIKSAKLVYSARVNNADATLQMMLYGTSYECNLLNRVWASQGTTLAPSLATSYGGTQTFSGTTLKKVETDVTAYVKSIVNSTSKPDTITFAFAAVETKSGAVLYVPVTGTEAPQLVIEME